MNYEGMTIKQLKERYRGHELSLIKHENMRVNPEHIQYCKDEMNAIRYELSKRQGD